ncbi:hypothetical protein AB0L82_05755 [Nocardia sp. NPDC052001]|uniref:hypothetical protein n=1 Tax=Nocardia sp. NPDC052001 TaxID=3154853 RepID=UPI00342B2EF7
MHTGLDDAAFLPQRERQIARGHTEQLSRWIHSWQEGVVPAPVKSPDPQPFLAVADRSANLCERLLTVLSPEAAVAAWWWANSEARIRLAHHTLLNRFLWVLAVGASGDSHDPAVLERYFVHAGRWWAAANIADDYRALTEGMSAAVQSAPGREFLSRTSSQVIRYNWVSRMICTEIGRQIEADDHYRAVLPEFTAATIDRSMEIALQYGALPDGSDLQITPWTDSASDFIADNLARRSGEFAKKRFVDMALSPELETRPWIAFADGVAPIALGTIRLGMERALLKAVDDKLLNHRNKGSHRLDKGELYERVSQECLRQSFHHLVGPQPPRPMTIAIPGENTPDIDCALINHGVQIIGEVKAMEVPENTRSVDRAFAQQISKIVDQLRKRLAALEKGTPLVDFAGGVHRGGVDTVALGVVLHNYSGSLSYPEMLQLLPTAVVDKRIAVADLHAWIIILTTMSSFEELRDYLEFRYRLLDLGVISSEECDMAVAFHNLQHGEDVIDYFRSRLLEHPDLEASFYLQGMWISAENAVQQARPTNPGVWKREFYDAAQAVPLL